MKLIASCRFLIIVATAIPHLSCSHAPWVNTEPPGGVYTFTDLTLQSPTRPGAATTYFLIRGGTSPTELISDRFRRITLSVDNVVVFDGVGDFARPSTADWAVLLPCRVRTGRGRYQVEFADAARRITARRDVVVEPPLTIVDIVYTVGNVPDVEITAKHAWPSFGIRCLDQVVDFRSLPEEPCAVLHLRVIPLNCGPAHAHWVRSGRVQLRINDRVAVSGTLDHQLMPRNVVPRSVSFGAVALVPHGAAAIVFEDQTLLARAEARIQVEGGEMLVVVAYACEKDERLVIRLGTLDHVRPDY